MLRTQWIDDAVSVPMPGYGVRPFWSRADVVREYEHAATVLAHRGKSLVGLWHLPIARDQQGAHARRPARLTPYCAPCVAGGHPQRRRRVVIELLRTVQAHVASIDLPMAPGFVEVTGCSELGLDTIWRHTRIVPQKDNWRNYYSPKARNQIRVGHRVSAMIEISKGYEAFDFGRGIVDCSPVRTRFAKALAKQARLRCLSAIDDQGITIGQALVVADAETAYLFHSWFDRTRQRGVPSALVDEAIAMSFDALKVDRFDFEGSILPTIDEFMSGFGGEIRPYPHLRWSANGAIGSTTPA